VYELEKRIVGEAEAGYRRAESEDRARIDREEELARVTRDRFDLIKRETGALLQTLFRRPGQFAGQLFSTIGNAALNPLVDAFSGATARFLSPWMFGSAPTASGVLPVMPGAGNGILFDSPPMAASMILAGAGDWGNGMYIAPTGVGGGGGSSSGMLSRMGGLFGKGGGLGSWLSGIQGTVFNSGNIYMGPWSGTNAAGIGGAAGTLAGIASSPAAMAAGGMLALHSLTGNGRGTFGGTLGATAGGALAGFAIGAHIGAIGGPLGAAIGAGAGLLAGLGMQIAGAEPPTRQAHRLIQSIYGVDIPERSGIVQQIVAMAQEVGSVSVAVRTPQARQLVEMYALSTGQQNSLFLTTPHAGSLIQQDGRLYQGLSYFNGSGYNFQSPFPTLGMSSGSIPTYSPFGGSGMNIQLDGPATTALLSGQVARVATPNYVAQQSVAALQTGDSRYRAAAAMLSPQTLFA
jgi:hypothetical protein